MLMCRFVVMAVAVLSAPRLSVPAAAGEVRQFLAVRGLCVAGPSGVSFQKGYGKVYHEFGPVQKRVHTACGTVHDRRRQVRTQFCKDFTLFAFELACQGRAVSAAEWWYAREAAHRNEYRLNGTTIRVPVRGHDGWRNAQGYWIETTGTVGRVALPAGFAPKPRDPNTTLTEPWQAMLSGAAIRTPGLTAAAAPPNVPAWVAALKTYWPLPQLGIGMPLAAFALIAFVGTRTWEPAGKGSGLIAAVAVTALAGVLVSAKPAAIPDAIVAGAGAQAAAAEHNRAKLRQLISAPSGGLLAPFSDGALSKAKTLIAAANRTARDPDPPDPALLAVFSFAPALLLLALGFTAFVRGWHYLFVAHPAFEATAEPLRAGHPFKPNEVAAALRPEVQRFARPPPAYQSQNLLKKSRALNERIESDGRIAEAAMRRDRARAQQIAAERELRAALRHLPWWRRWLGWY